MTNRRSPSSLSRACALELPEVVFPSALCWLPFFSTFGAFAYLLYLLIWPLGTELASSSYQALYLPHFPPIAKQNPAQKPSLSLRAIVTTSILEELSIAFRASVATAASWVRRRNEHCETRTITCHGCGVKVTAQQHACHSWTALNLADRMRMSHMNSQGLCDRIHAVVKCQYDLA